MTKFLIGDLQHCLASEDERLCFIALMNVKHKIQVEFYGEDSMRFYGRYDNVLAAVIEHYHGDEDEAFALHPELNLGK